MPPSSFRLKLPDVSLLSGVFPHIFGAAIAILFGWIFLLLLATIRRAHNSRMNWSRTPGRILSFGVTYGAAAVYYEYTVNGQTRTGTKFSPGPFAKSSHTGTPEKSLYLNLDGSLKFMPKSTVEVYYDPANPADAALVPGLQPGFWKGIVGVLFVLGLFVGGLRMMTGHDQWLKAHGLMLFGIFFSGAGVFLFFYAWRCLGRLRRSRDFPSVPGRVLKAEIRYSSGGESSGGFVPVVEFEYEVGGRLYRSKQLTAISAQVLKSNRKNVQPMIDQFLADPAVDVYYDPQAPWDGFLSHGPSWGAWMPLAMSLVFAGVGLAVIYCKIR